MDVVVLILAGGMGARIGGHKAEKLLAGRRLIDITLNTARQWDLPIAIQLAYEDQVSLLGVPQILDDPDIDGPLAGLIAGLKWAKSQKFDAILTLPCDCPFLPSDLYKKLLNAVSDRHHVAIAVSAGRLHPVCALWQTHHLSTLEANAKAGKLSMTRSAIECGYIEVEWEASSAQQCIDPFFNINTPDDLAEAESYLSNSNPQP